MSAAEQQILYERRGAAAWLVLDRPAVLNSLTSAMLIGLRRHLAAAEADPGVRCVVVTGAGRGFCAGVDLGDARGNRESDTRAVLEELRDALLALEASPLPVIAAVNGVACAGGLELLLACDLVIAAEQARIGDAHANFGLIPGGGCSVRLPERIGMARARRLLLTGELLPARTLEEWGLVGEVVPAEELEAAAGRLVALLAAKSPLAAARVKRLMAQARELPRREALDREIAAVVEHAGSADMAEGLAAFAEKRVPRFTGA